MATGSSGKSTAAAEVTSISGVDIESDTPVAIKIPSIDLRDDAAYLKRFLMEEWIARRIDSPHVVEAPPAVAKAQLPLCRNGIHRGANAPPVDDRQSEAGSGGRARDWSSKIAKGLRAFHRKEMLHQT